MGKIPASTSFFSTTNQPGSRQKPLEQGLSPSRLKRINFEAPHRSAASIAKRMA
jgi:hypothetical protein